MKLATFDRDESTGSVLVGADDLALVPGAESAIRGEIDRIFDKLHRPVGHAEVDAAGVHAPEAPIPERVAWTARNVGIHQPVGRKYQGPGEQTRVTDRAGPVPRRVGCGNSIGAASDTAETARVAPPPDDVAEHPRTAGIHRTELRHLADEEGIARAVGHIRDSNGTFGPKHAIADRPTARIGSLDGDSRTVDPIENRGFPRPSIATVGVLADGDKKIRGGEIGRASCRERVWR